MTMIVFNQETFQIPKGGLPIIRTYAKSKSKKEVPNQKKSASRLYFKSTLVTSISMTSDWKHKCSTYILNFGPCQTPWKTTMESAPSEPVQIPCELGQRSHLPLIYDYADFLDS